MIRINEIIKYMDIPYDRNLLSSSSLFIDDDIKVLIDSSCGQKNMDYLQTRGVDVIINSHFHEDHILYNHKFPQASIWAHEKDAPAIQSLEEFKRYHSFYYFKEDKLWEKYIKRFDYVPTTVNRELQDGELLDFGKTKVMIMHMPGHTPGNCSFLFENSILFSIDMDLREFGPWYGHMCSSIDDYISSIKLCQEIKPKMIITSHNGIITENIQAKLQRYLDVIFIREEKVLEALKKPSTLEELTDQFIFYGPVRSNLVLRRIWERMAIYLHLKRLLVNKRIEYNQDDKIYYLV